MKKKMQKNIWEQVPVNYYQKGIKVNLLQKLWHQLKIRSAKKALRDIHFNNILDIGCASGYMLSKIALFYPNAKYYGVDIYREAINFAKKIYPNMILKVAAAEKLPFKDNAFDAVIFYEALEHVQNPSLALKEFKRVLKKNGTGIVAMDSGNLLFRFIWFIWENTTGKVWKGAHLHPFHHKELEKLINKTGLRIKKKFFTHLGMEVTFILIK